MDLYLLKFNNYFNRICKKFENLSDYLNSKFYDGKSKIENVNFNPNDGVNTFQIINFKTKCDYCVLANGNEIISRWFILEAKSERASQFLLTLRRDLIADNYDKIINAPAFIEKATVNPNDPSIFNNEGMTFNQIKQSEELLKDESNSAWIVGYIPRDSFKDETTIKAKIDITGTQDVEVENLSDFIYYKFSATPDQVEPEVFVRNPQNIAFGTGVRFGADNRSGQFVYFDSETNHGFINEKVDYLVDNTGVGLWQSPSNVPLTNDVLYLYKNIHNYLQDMIYESKFYTDSSEINGITFEDFISYDNKIIYVNSEKKYYKIYIRKITRPLFPDGNISNRKKINITSKLAQDYWIPMLSTGFENLLDNGSGIGGAIEENSLRIDYTYNAYVMELLEVTSSETVSTKISSDRYHVENQPFDIFCIPYSENLEIVLPSGYSFRNNQRAALEMATAIGMQSGAANVYDIQLLPYNPARFLKFGKVNTATALDLTQTPDIKYNVIKSVLPRSVIIWATNSDFSFSIKKEIEIKNFKVENETEFYRLVSPNQNGQFEFSAAKNNGVSEINVDCSYKPFNPYIHLNPNFKRLYGANFHDARGLICGGDFSLPQGSNAWANYQLANKNYQNIFDRQIENMEVNNYYSNLKQLVAGAAGAGSTAATLSVVNPVLGIVGGIASAAGALADYKINKALQNEALDYKEDLFNYNLGNIKAMPSSLSKNSALNPNNKLFPFLEKYSCSEIEKQALIDKLKFNGMTVMRIAKIKDFLQPEISYIKAKIIRLEDLTDDTNYLNEIANEINKGVFIK